MEIRQKNIVCGQGGVRDERTLYEWGDSFDPNLSVSVSKTHRKVTVSKSSRSVAINFEDIPRLVKILQEGVIREMVLTGQCKWPNWWP